ncbi:MAG: alanine racemase [Pirellulaceae bacterium]|nr:MAG: alanine racemase [Pirellulaceae bacterium]
MTQPPEPGTIVTWEEIDTPFLAVDLDALDYNVQVLVSWCRRYGKQWRPHAKCHKCPELAKRLLAAGATGLTCAKSSEALVFAEYGIRDLLIANFVVGKHKLERVVAICRLADPIICVDHIEQAIALDEVLGRHALTARVLIEVDIGMQRAGAKPGEALRLALELARLPHLELAGLMGYEGHLLCVADPDEKRQRIHRALDILGELTQKLSQHGIGCQIVSCGGTGSLPYCLEHPAPTELQAGGGIFMDEFYRHHCRALALRQALWVEATVVSCPDERRVIIDAGRKSLSLDLAWPRIVVPPGCHLRGLSAEHGVVELPPQVQRPRLGSRMKLLPGYGDFTTVLHDRFVVGTAEGVVGFWPLAARGRLQ